MIHPDILAALARERSGTFLAEAEAARRARQARTHHQPGRASGTRTTRRPPRSPADEPTGNARHRRVELMPYWPW